ncbi:MAG: DUF2752 domain-containing protein, partial [Planctomycetota bacterium]
LWDFPCPTCGMTTAFAHAADGHLIRSFSTQPAGGLLALLLAVGVWAGMYTAATGSRVLAVCMGLLRPRLLIAAVSFVLAAWVYKMVTWSG